jgi:tRNA1Val (adenine37-N6)-methyltransferase
VDAVEIDQDACLQAIENAKRSPWNDRICMYRDSFQHFASTSNNRYDLIVSNPPYFRNALRPGDKRKSNARHDTGLSFEELLHGASSLLTGEGKLCVILPMSESETFIGLARIYSMYCYRIAAVKTTSVASFSRALMAFNRNPSSGCSRIEFTIDRGEGQYSHEYIEMTKDFYLNR